ncbi:MAG: hypothetical protein R3345_11240 [Fulvivirga sp.]|nr:hypothetical protein [Fulvivirga sp.]
MSQTYNHPLFSINRWIFFTLLCLLTFMVLLLKKSFVELETTAFQILDQRGEMGFFHLLSGLQFITIPLIYLFKFTVIGFIIWVGCFMYGYNVSFGQAWHVVMICETLFLLPELLKIIWFVFIAEDSNLFEIRSFYPLSLIHLIDPYEVPKRLLYPLKALNIFEVIYWLLLVQGIHFMAQKKKSTAYAIIFTSYVPLFLLWLGFYAIVYK